MATSRAVRDRAVECSLKNFQDHRFIPDINIRKLLPDDVIDACIRESAKLEGPDWVKDCCDTIKSGGRKILLILIQVEKVHLVIKFVDSQNAIDSRLPFEENQLEQILDSKADAEVFYEKQWSVIPASFGRDITHRTHQARAIMPFLKEEELGGGAFGDVYKVHLLGTQHEFHGIESNGEMVHRRSKYKNEDKISTLLRSLRHENIVRLLASYTINTSPPEYNFLFPVADTALSSLFKAKDRKTWDSHFPSDTALFQQLYGLASAIEQLHFFVINSDSDGENILRLIGCHYDLKPGNILVDKGRLLLADFGLSRLKPDSSKSAFKEGAGDYMAPECEPDSETFEKGIINRSSDIWSFGGIILDILTYHTGGEKALTAFRNSRRSTKKNPWGPYTTRQFHIHGQKANPAVSACMQQLVADYPATTASFQVLVESMLLVEPKNRIKARQVTLGLFFVAQRAAFKQATDAFEQIHGIHKSKSSLSAYIEFRRFHIWGCGSSLQHHPPVQCSELPDTAASRDWLEKSPDQFEVVRETLHMIVKELQDLKEISQAKTCNTWPVFKRLQELIDRLWEAQRLGEGRLLRPHPLWKTMERWVVTQILNRGKVESLWDTLKDLEFNTQFKDLARIAALKYMTARLENTKNKGSRSLFVDDMMIPGSTRNSGIHTIGRLDSGKPPFLVEYMSYNHGDRHDHWKSLLRRANNLAVLLNGKLPDDYFDALPRDFRVLRCTGYFHDPLKSSFGFMYEFPAKASDTSPMPVTLKEVIRKFERPDLEAVFELALALVKCVSAFHTVGWLHKNISSHTVLFFDSELLRLFGDNNNVATRQQPPQALQNPYVVGLNHTRENTTQALTTEASREPKLQLYHHPKYLRQSDLSASGGGERFHAKYDWYSVGLVLLELGLWTWTEDMLWVATTKPVLGETARLRLKSDWLPRLNVRMGRSYRDAVEACLNCEKDEDSDYEVLVVDRLERCFNY
ncbi:kinase-like domain-containing protein [Rhypophila decipiens]|uniref:Kinase-like domain-containing protein n=1 Tax=Rhypophila decipiens TaxID=261697 RepID=A0AAN7B6F4_9PEZI|nr:kinase-like domain-containing protein [Rhypophila decipiens]